jgi:hypothetical protein
VNFIQQQAVQAIKDRDGKVFTFDHGHSMRPLIERHAQAKLDRMRRHGSRMVKVAVRRAGFLHPTAALAAVRSALAKNR